MSPAAARIIAKYRGKIELPLRTVFVPALLESTEEIDLPSVQRLCGIHLSPFASDYVGDPPLLLLTDDEENFYSWYMYEDENWYLVKSPYDFETYLSCGFGGAKKFRPCVDADEKPFLECCDILLGDANAANATKDTLTTDNATADDGGSDAEAKSPIAIRLSQRSSSIDISGVEYRTEFETVEVQMKPQAFGGWHRSEAFGVNCFVATAIATGNEIVLMQIAKYDFEFETLYPIEQEIKLDVLFSKDKTRGIVISNVAMK